VIRINLLPLELQKAARTPRMVFYTLAVSTAVVTVAGVGLLWMWITAGNMEALAMERQAHLATLQQEAAEVDRINEDIAFYKQREDAILKIKTRRILWAPKLDQLVFLTPEEIWITGLEMRTLDPGEYQWDTRGGGVQTGGRLTLDCISNGTDPSSFTRFRAALAEDTRFYRDLVDVSSLPDNFFGEFIGFTDHAWSVIEGAGEVGDLLRSRIEIDLKPLHDPPAPPPPAKKKEEKKG